MATHFYALRSGATSVIEAAYNRMLHFEEPPQIKRVDLASSVGMTRAEFAFVFVLISGLSLPLGACLGIALSPVDDKFVGAMMAFGAGALLFAVTVELYSHTLHEVRQETLGTMEMITQITGTIIGGAFYITINKWLEEYLVADHSEDDKDIENDETSPLVKPVSDYSAIERSAPTEDSLGQSTNVARLGRRHTDVAGLADGFAAESGTTKQELMSALHTSMLQTKEVKSKMQKSIKGRERVLQSLATKSKGLQEDEHEDHTRAKSVALALFLGLLVDGVPEGILMGFLSAEGHLTPVMIISLFIANFPEAFSSASLFMEAEMSKAMVISMWSGLCLGTAALGGASCYLLLYFFPTYGTPQEETLPMSVLLGLSLVEGVTGGAMLTCISAVMLPEAFERTGKGREGHFWRQSGFLCTAGFLLSVALTAMFG